MIQIYFFISMLALAALLLNLWWYLEDSRREEQAFDQAHDGAGRRMHPRNPDTASSRGGAVIQRMHPSPNPGRTFGVDSMRPTASPMVCFYEIGVTDEVPSFQSFIHDQSKSA